MKEGSVVSTERERIAKQLLQQQKLAQRKILLQKFKQTARDTFTAANVILLLTVIVNIGAVLTSIYSSYAIYEAVIAKDFYSIAGYVILMSVVNLYTFVFNKNFNIEFKS